MSTPVGKTPVSVTFKRYKDKAYFAVACLRDAHLYLLDAGKFDLVKKVPLVSSDVTLVTTATNEADPFLYYCYRNGVEDFTGRVNLERMADEGTLFHDSTECAVSASGWLLYRRDGYSPSEFECMRRRESQTGGKPRFDRLFYDHDKHSTFVPDPFDRYTASGKAIYTATLRQKVAELDFTPLCFVPDRPVIAGLSGDEWYGLSIDLGAPFDEVRPRDLITASYNSFENTSRTKLPATLFDKIRLSRPTADDMELWRVRYHLRMFVDPKRDRIVIAAKDQAVLVPLEALKLKDEPLCRFRQTNRHGCQSAKRPR